MPLPTALPFPTIRYDFGSEVVEEYIIPDDKKTEVLKLLYFGNRPPDLDDVYEDIHENRTFRIRDFKVVKDSGGLWLVSPYYFSSGGTVIDWVPVRRKRHPSRAASAAVASGAPVEVPACPKCGAPMKRKLARTGFNAGNHFWSCSNYPACRGTRPCTEPSGSTKTAFLGPDSSNLPF